MTGKKKLRRRSLDNTQEQDNASYMSCSLIDLNKKNVTATNNDGLLNKALESALSSKVHSITTFSQKENQEQKNCLKQGNNEQGKPKVKHLNFIKDYK